MAISTHTLTWSVTFSCGGYLTRYINFNSHAHVERDFFVEFPHPALINFNSHAHVERDYQHPVCEEFKDISTHTLTWSVTTSTSNTNMTI